MKTLVTLFVFLPLFAAAQLYTPGGNVQSTSSPTNVGIGAATPSDNLHVVGTSRLNTDSGLPQNATANDAENYTAKYAHRFTSNNNGFFISMSNLSNDRRVFLQSGHRDSPYAGSVGHISLNPFGGSVGVGITANPVGTLDVKVREVATSNSENVILNLLSRPGGAGMVDNLFQFNQGAGAENSQTYAVFRMGNHYTNNGVPDEIVLSANGDTGCKMPL